VWRPRFFKNCRATEKKKKFYFYTHTHTRYLLVADNVCCNNAPISFAMTICPHVTTRETLNGFSSNSTLGSFTKIYRSILIFVKIGQQQRVLCSEDTHSFLRAVLTFKPRGEFPAKRPPTQPHGGIPVMASSANVTSARRSAHTEIIYSRQQ
jgi:hypothetical protein